MSKAFVLVRNFVSTTKHLDFGDFTISQVGGRFEEMRETFSASDVNGQDWVLEKPYPSVIAVSRDVEDMLLLFRLFKVGDIAFCRQATVTANGTNIPPPYQAMNDLNSFSEPLFHMTPDECGAWNTFSTGIRGSPSWTSDWFGIARRFFLSGGAKKFAPKSDDVDRIVDYATALEASLVPEKDYNLTRITRRGAALIESDETKHTELMALLKRFYEIRSRIVHGSGLDDKNRKWLLQHSDVIERHVRQVLVTALRQIPPAEEDRRAALKGLYDPTDEDRGKSALAKFKEIKTEPVRTAIATEIARIARVNAGLSPEDN